MIAEWLYVLIFPIVYSLVAAVRHCADKSCGLRRKAGSHGDDHVPAYFYPAQQAVLTMGLTHKHRLDMLGGVKASAYLFTTTQAVTGLLRRVVR